jgi:transposase
MRGDEKQQPVMFSYIDLEQRVPGAHPLRAIRRMVDQALADLSLHFEALYARRGRPSIPPEQLLRALLLQALYAIRSEVSQRLLAAVVEQARAQGFLSEEHFTVDGTLLEAWANRNSFAPKDPPPAKGTGSGGRKLLRDTHESSTDAEARLYKKSTAGESKPSYLGHVIVENRNGLVVAACATQSSTTAEREAALAMLDEMKRAGGSPATSPKPITLGADKLYQEEKFIEALRQRGIAPHVAEYEKATTHWPNFLTAAERHDARRAISQKKRKRVEMVFGWGKGNSMMRKIKLHGVKRVDWLFRLLATANNLVRMVKLQKLIPAQ